MREQVSELVTAESVAPSGQSENGRESRRLVVADFLVLGLSTISLFVSCFIVSQKRYFWNDELYSWYFVSDPSFASMWEAFNDAINNTPALYFVLGWLWAQPFGSSELSLRLFSSLGIIISIVFVWKILRREYGFWPTSVGVLVVFFTSLMILEQNAEARMYGLFLSLSMAGIYQALRNADVMYLGVRQLIGIALLHAALVNTHLFGPFFSAATLAAIVVMDSLRGRYRLRVYLAVVAGWSSFLLYLPAFFAQADAGNPRAWMPLPTVGDLLSLAGLAEPAFADVRFIVFVGAVLIAVYSIRGRTAESVISRGRRDLMVIAAMFGLVIIVTFVFSVTIKPILWDRYVIPVLFSYCVACTHLASTFLRSRGDENVAPFQGVLVQCLGVLVIAVLLVNPIIFGLKQNKTNVPGTYDFAYGYENLPVVVSRSGGLLVRYHYSPRRSQYFYILDEEAALAPESGPFGVQDYKHMRAYRRNYPESVGRQIVTSEEFLSRVDSFLVHDTIDYTADCPVRVVGFARARTWRGMHCPKWLEERVLDNPEFEVRELGDRWGLMTLLVTRKAV